MNIDLLIATAIVSEFSCVARGIGRGGRRHEDYRLQVSKIGTKNVALVQIGVGPVRARRAMKWAIEQLDPIRVMMVGIAGGLDPTLQRGHMLVPDQLIDERGTIRSMATQEPFFEPITPATLILQADRVILDPNEKQSLHVQTGACAVDMESLAVARVCEENRRPMQAIRFIADTASDLLPSEIVNLVDEAGNPRLLTALGRIARRPSLLPELLPLERSNKLVHQAMIAWAQRLRQRILDSK
jgi:adenosylhomocysteine nucleosidase